HRRRALRTVRAGQDPQGTRRVTGLSKREPSKGMKRGLPARRLPTRYGHRTQLFAGALALALASPAFAQMGPGGFGGPGGMQPPPPPGQGAEKEEGPAEEAPEENRPSDLEPLSGYAEQGKHRMQIFELDGYLRLRTDYMHQFFLGQGYYVGEGEM